MAEKSGTLTFRNPDQKVIWECELTGQLSDGQWENTEPQDHWEPWCNAEVIVDPEHVGRDFPVKKDGYGFTRKEFLHEGFDLAGRVMGYVRVARTFGYGKDVRAIADYGGREDGYISAHVSAETKRIIETEGARILAVMDDESIYNLDQLMADLRDISAIIKVRNDVDVDQLVLYTGGRHDTIHKASCRKVRNVVDWKLRDITQAYAAASQSRGYYGARIDPDCLPWDNEQHVDIRAMAEQTKADRDCAAKRRKDLSDLAAAQVANAKLAEKVGTMTEQERQDYHDMVGRLTDKQSAIAS